jgi:hypothetical protein
MGGWKDLVVAAASMYSAYAVQPALLISSEFLPTSEGEELAVCCVTLGSPLALNGRLFDQVDMLS